MHERCKPLERRLPARLASSPSMFVTVIGIGLFSASVAGAPEEIQVYMDDMSKPGRFGMDVHNNFVMSGSDSPEYPGAQPPNHVYRLTPEFYYGIGDVLELGLYVLTTKASGDSVNYDGAKIRMKYVYPHDETVGSFWGANLEIGKTSLRVSQAAWNAELKGIYGYRSGRWTFAVNPNLDWSLSAPSSPLSLDIDTKIAYKTNAGYQLGIESYNELGPVSNLGHLNQQSETLYAVVDTQLGKLDLNAGFGYGLTSVSDSWVFKFIIGIHF
jgi:hypothetical protein